MGECKSLLLLIDDDSVCNSINKIILKKKFIELKDCSCDIISFISPLEGFKYLSKILSEGEFGRIIILLDINMPEMNGWEFLEEYSRLNHFKSEIVIFILTSSVNQGDIDKAGEDINVTGFMTKPLTSQNAEKLFEVMAN